MSTTGMDSASRSYFDPDTSTISTESVASTDSDAGVHPLLAQYFDKAGDLMILQGHLEDLDSQETNKLTQRELLRDQEAPLPDTDEEFARYYHNKRSELRSRLEAVQARVNALRTDCDNAGLDVDRAKWRGVRPPTTTSPPGYQHATVSDVSMLPQAYQSISASQPSSSREHVESPEGSTTNNDTPRNLDLIARFKLLRPTSSVSSTEPATVHDIPTPRIRSPVTVDPELQKVYGVTARRYVAGTSGDAEPLDACG